jgi:hypothetical protein
MMITARNYRGIEDIPLLTSFAGENLALRNGCSYWHPGDIVWVLYTHSHMNLFDNRQDIRIWVDDDTQSCCALAWFYNRTHLRFDIQPGHHLELIEEVIHWAESRCRQLNPDRERIVFSTNAQDTDEPRCEALRDSGYRVIDERAEDVLCSDLTGRISVRSAPDGMMVHDCVDVNEHDRAACHRDAWSSLGHIGRPDQVSQFHDSIYGELRGADLYNPELDLVVKKADGEMTACCIAWTDEISRFGIFEPVGTRPAYRGLRLSALMTESAMLRLKEKGMDGALVMSSPENNPTAYKSYRRVFEPIGRIRYYLKDL